MYLICFKTSSEGIQLSPDVPVWQLPFLKNTRDLNLRIDFICPEYGKEFFFLVSICEFNLDVRIVLLHALLVLHMVFANCQRGVVWLRMAEESVNGGRYGWLLAFVTRMVLSCHMSVMCRLLGQPRCRVAEDGG